MKFEWRKSLSDITDSSVTRDREREEIGIFLLQGIILVCGVSGIELFESRLELT